ncbi:predicted protein [Pyrenophora tritici-repentis Pt-1C-BFP]|uniref:Uncharacterized protein n=1 Tax=Pyrenophora tritici-repentis (strain Pt-1C-BFP) TaxID=426418 RepID=B2W2F7_PYRTR|nr:uncharacterized protein PTRG_03605 [Pyrenophora tritici-repentis Pt-1C-BFP]EDU46443.1 predicted protein [Pyrenophora tritici-repentis Pt-1C-BFP]
MAQEPFTRNTESNLATGDDALGPQRESEIVMSIIVRPTPTPTQPFHFDFLLADY